MAVDTRSIEAIRPDADDAEMMTVPEAARLMRVNEDTLRRWLRNGNIPGARFGMTTGGLERRHWRIPRSALKLAMVNVPEGHSMADPSRPLESFRRKAV